MSLLNFDSREPKSRGKKISLKALLGVGGLVGTIFLGQTLAANLNLNTGTPVEFGQGVAQTTACDDNIVITPASKFVNANSAGGFSFSSVTLSDINSDLSHCKGKQFVITAYGSGNSPLELYSGSTSLIVCDKGDSFKSFSPNDYPVTSSDGNSFKATMSAPVASAESVERILVESSNATCAAAPRTFNQTVEIPTGNGSPVVINSLLESDKLTATGFSGRVRAIVSVDCGNVAITSTGGLSLVYGYQDPLDAPASEIAFDGSATNINLALDTLVYDRSTCSGTQHMTGSVAQTGTDPDSPVSYNPENFHYYQFVSSPYSWEEAFNKITGSTLEGFDDGIDSIGNYNLGRSYSSCFYKFNGMCGYMATLTSSAENTFVGVKGGQSNVWLGGTDRRQVGTWKWEDDRAPEYDQIIGVQKFEENCAAVSGGYSNWDEGEPNSYRCDGSTTTSSRESALQTIHGDNPHWNNLYEVDSQEDGGVDYGVTGYIVEYGDSPVDIGPLKRPEKHNITLRLQ